jgi:hypothetical protein
VPGCYSKWLGYYNLCLTGLIACALGVRGWSWIGAVLLGLFPVMMVSSAIARRLLPPALIFSDDYLPCPRTSAADAWRRSQRQTSRRSSWSRQAVLKRLMADATAVRLELIVIAQVASHAGSFEGSFPISACASSNWSTIA